MIPNVFNINFAEPIVFLWLCIVIFAIVVFRYFLLAGIFHLYFYIWKSKTWEIRKLNKKQYPPEQFRKEIFWSLLTALIFSVIGAFTAVLWQQGHTAIYLDINAFPLLWFPVSILLSMFIHETYYYWVHRWMHQPKVYKIVHHVHHESKITSAWTAFSFHPIEGILEALIMPLIVILLPMHIYAILIHLTIMTITAAINHLDIEIYPKNIVGNQLGKYMIGATHHSHHHKYYRYNYGLYFTFWDKIGKTESPNFVKEFDERKEIQ
ncbi:MULTISPECIES: sterol desaturase family protein [unclassified Arcicella]|uniref:sterol desaturase family protein n=1 Tax=unclassified Arcicella TaxID=2644986 RepID=UPI002854B8F7|nr:MULTISPECIES: sterol desaturase family protein [unclassified Arcicella]MDR6563458.1 sterol desaturase/sphingolipid hydroxylase (fatty acid hydroxylase superfamily) [Arcicella sp. BE51]MDR6813430.1 sterol desaturase/sphingolipid hydroxylase (fatty acid hydroxylase superfamily) [Arcicella sp. BE140]MDR6824743.1 sterol desaturase/sphingolipid hydroxylase (fatty acid hydroxylase superfamily) [Arcicella sp. BE139]